MLLFVKLILAHLIGDFVLQPLKWAIHKQANKVTSKYLYVHIAIHFLLLLLIVWDIQFWKIALCISISHYIIDLTKLYGDRFFKNKAIPFLLDQAVHVIVLYVCAFHDDLYHQTVVLFQHLDWYLLTAALFVTTPASIIMGKLLLGLSDQIDTDHKSLPNAGKYIGIIERLFVLTFIVIGRWEVIGFLIAAKSVFRFNDLKERNNRKLTEYILIGTLVSFGLAIITGIIYTAL